MENDAIALDDKGDLPERYSLSLGLSRRMTVYELAETVTDSFMEFVDTGDPMWLGITNTTLDELDQRQQALQERLTAIEIGAAVMEQAAETVDHAHAEAVRIEYHRRGEILERLNRAFGEQPDDD